MDVFIVNCFTMTNLSPRSDRLWKNILQSVNMNLILHSWHFNGPFQQQLFSAISQPFLDSLASVLKKRLRSLVKKKKLPVCFGLY